MILTLESLGNKTETTTVTKFIAFNPENRKSLK